MAGRASGEQQDQGGQYYRYPSDIEKTIIHLHNVFSSRNAWEQQNGTGLAAKKSKGYAMGLKFNFNPYFGLLALRTWQHCFSVSGKTFRELQYFPALQNRPLHETSP